MTAGLLLSKQETDKFLLYAKQVVDSGKQIINAMSKGPQNPITETLVKQERQKIAAYLIVIADLENMEEQTIG